MEYISMKDLRVLVNSARYEVESAKRFLNHKDEIVRGMSRKKIDALEPVVERIESQLVNAKIPVR